jgi:hypothetical protein
MSRGVFCDLIEKLWYGVECSFGMGLSSSSPVIIRSISFIQIGAGMVSRDSDFFVKFPIRFHFGTCSTSCTCDRAGPRAESQTAVKCTVVRLVILQL